MEVGEVSETSIKVGTPMQLIAVDILGPLPESENLPTSSFSEQLHSDQGKQFESTVIAEVCKLELLGTYCQVLYNSLPPTMRWSGRTL